MLVYTTEYLNESRQLKIVDFYKEIKNISKALES